MSLGKVWNGTEWVGGGFPGIKARGGEIFDYTSSGVSYRSHTFLFQTNGEFIVDEIGSFGPDVDYMLVAGGGSGGSGYSGSNTGGGGGAGGMIVGTVAVSPQTYSITVGLGGHLKGDPRGQQNPGENSTAFGLTAVGGGAGGGNNSAGGAGGSGGGGNGGGAGVSGQGNNGGVRGGGGKGGAGSGNNGGVGLSNDYRSGSSEFYAGGGGAAAAPGGSGVGGNGAGSAFNAIGTRGVEGKGGGGGNGSPGLHLEVSPGRESPGGSGIVVVRYQLS